jgi:hydroxyacylglutathione hydrolase
MSMKIQTYTVNPFQENTYALFYEGKTILIDPGFFNASEVNLFLSDLEKYNAELCAILLTHAHVDHILGLQRVKDRFDVPVYLSHADLHLWENYFSQSSMFGFQTTPFDFVPLDYNGEGVFTIGPFSMIVLHTPGHSPDHVSLYFESEEVLIAGDVLFQGSIGRTDLYKGDFDLLAKTIKEKLYVLPDSTRVLPGHGQETTIGDEKQSNPFVKA